jgi:hypothetical protein
MASVYNECLQIGRSSNSIGLGAEHKLGGEIEPQRVSAAPLRSEISDKFHMLIRVGGCLGPSTISRLHHLAFPPPPIA